MHPHSNASARERTWARRQFGRSWRQPSRNESSSNHAAQSYIKFLVLGFLFAIPCQLLGAQNQPVLATGASQQQIGTGVTVPSDTKIPLTLQNALSSKTAYVGQSIYCRTIFPITVDDRIVIPVGSYVEGTVTQVIHPGRIKGKAKLGLRFDSITLPSGTTRPLRATLSAFGGNGQEGFNRKEAKINGGSSKDRDAGRIARTTVIGAEIGSLAGIGHGRTLRGLGIGSAAGAAGGVIWVLATRGRQIYLPCGTSLELQLAAPLTFDLEGN
jgi:hypothetical protein